MERTRFDQRAELVIDICPSHGMWLDAGELVMLLEYIRERASGHITQSAAAREENEHWSQIERSLVNEAQVVNAHLAHAEAAQWQGGQGRGTVLVATAVGGPWLGLFVALRKLRKR